MSALRSVAPLVSSVSTSPAKASTVALTLAMVRSPLLLPVPEMLIFWPATKPSASQLPPASLRVMVSLALATRSNTRPATVACVVPLNLTRKSSMRCTL